MENTKGTSRGSSGYCVATEKQLSNFQAIWLSLWLQNADVALASGGSSCALKCSESRINNWEIFCELLNILAIYFPWPPSILRAPLCPPHNKYHPHSITSFRLFRFSVKSTKVPVPPGGTKRSGRQSSSNFLVRKRGDSKTPKSESISTMASRVTSDFLHARLVKLDSLQSAQNICINAPLEIPRCDFNCRHTDPLPSLFRGTLSHSALKSQLDLLPQSSSSLPSYISTLPIPAVAIPWLRLNARQNKCPMLFILCVRVCPTLPKYVLFLVFYPSTSWCFSAGVLQVKWDWKTPSTCGIWQLRAKRG